MTTPENSQPTGALVRVDPPPTCSPSDWPACSGDPVCCPENSGHGCGKPNPEKALAATKCTHKRFDGASAVTDRGFIYPHYSCRLCGEEFGETFPANTKDVLPNGLAQSDC